MARTAGKDPGAMKANKTPRGKHKKAKSSGRLGQGSRDEWAPRPIKTQPSGARKTKKIRGSHGFWSDTLDDSDDDWLSSMSGKQRESGATSPTAISGYRTPPAVKRARNGSTGGGGSQQVAAPAMSAAGTRKRKSEGGGGTSGDGTGGGRQRRNRTKRGAAAPAPAAAAAATTASITNSGPARRSNRTTSGGGSSGGGDTGGGTGISPAASTTTTPPPSTASPADVPATREDIMSRIRSQLTPEQQTEWDATTGGDSWSPSQGPVEVEDVQGQGDISALKTRLTGRQVPTHAAGVGNVVFRQGVLWDRLTCKILAFPVSFHHFMGGPEEWEGKNAAVVWRNNVYWLDEDGTLINGQCCTAHYLGQVMQRCGLDHVFVCDASGVAHPRAGSSLKKGDERTRELVTAHVEYLLGSGRRMLEVHSRGTTSRFLEVVEGMATAGNADISIKIGSGKVRVHVFFGVQCDPGGELDTVVLFGTDHHSMMRFSFVANSIIRSQIAASALAGNPLTQAQTNELWAMSKTGTMTPEEWKEHYEVLLEELGPELLEKFEGYVEKNGGDMDRAYQSLIGWKGWLAAKDALPTIKAKRGGEWERAENAGCQEVERLKKKPSTRLNAKDIATKGEEVAIVRNKLYQQNLRWERSVGAMHFGNAANYAAWVEAKKTIADGNATKPNKEKATAVMAKLEQEKKERLSAQAIAPLREKTVKHAAHQRTIDSGRTPLRSNVNYTAKERGAEKSTNELKAEGGRQQATGVGCAPGSNGNATGGVPSEGVADHRTHVGMFYRWCAECKQVSPGRSSFYVFQGIPTLNNGRKTLAMPPHFTHGGCWHVCLPCDKHGNIAALVTDYPASDRLSAVQCRALARANVG